MDDVAVDPGPAEVHLRLDRAALAEAEHPGHRRDAVQVDVAADLGAEHPRVPGHVRRAGERRGPELVDDPAGEPEPEVDPPSAWIAARDRRRAAAGARRPRRAASGRAATGRPAPPRRGRAGCRVGSQSSPAQARAWQPSALQVSHRGPASARTPRVAATWPVWVFSGTAGTLRSLAGPLSAMPSRWRRQGADGRPLVDVPDRDVGEPRPEPGDELRRREAAPAEVEEVVAGLLHRRAQDVEPQLGHPRLGVREPAVGRGRRSASAATAGRRGRPCPTYGWAACRAPPAEGPTLRAGHGAAAPATGLVEGVADGQVAHEQLVARRRTTDRRGRAADARQREQRAVDLAELDAPTAELHLVVGPPAEEEAVGLEDHQVAGAVGAIPAQAGERGVLLGVLRRVQVARQADATDDQLARLAGRDVAAVGIDDREVPAVQRQPDRDGRRRRSAGRRRPRRWPRSGRRCSTPRGPQRPGERRAPAGTPRHP